MSLFCIRVHLVWLYEVAIISQPYASHVDSREGDSISKATSRSADNVSQKCPLLYFQIRMFVKLIMSRYFAWMTREVSRGAGNKIIVDLHGV